MHTKTEHTVYIQSDLVMWYHSHGVGLVRVKTQHIKNAKHSSTVIWKKKYYI